MFLQLQRRLIPALVCLSLWLAASTAAAQVVVTTSGNVATADISLQANGQTYAATVTISFDSALNLTPESLNLTAQLINPWDPTLTARLPLGVTASSAFPVMITVEPPDFGWIFGSGFEPDEANAGDLTFLDTYEFEVHTANLSYVAPSAYRLFKAPIGGSFIDITDSVLPGSVRARGRGGAFSQFLVVADSRPTLAVALLKIATLQTRILSANLSDALRAQLLGLLAQVQAALSGGVPDDCAAIADLNQLIAVIQGNAGTGIANVWRAERDLVNDAGEMDSLAETLLYTLDLMSPPGGCPAP